MDFNLNLKGLSFSLNRIRLQDQNKSTRLKLYENWSQNF